jgi:hypothetical protein
MSRDAIRTVTSSSDKATDQDWTLVTGTDVGTDPSAKRALDVSLQDVASGVEVTANTVREAEEKRDTQMLIGIMEDVLCELKIISMHLSIGSGLDIDKGDGESPE